MDTRVDSSLASRQASIAALGAEYACMSEQRVRVLALVGEFQRAIALKRDRAQAVSILRALVPSLHVYFSLVETMLDKITPLGAAPHRMEHRRILDEMIQTIDRCVFKGPEAAGPELEHALDALVIREATIRLRRPGGH
jgi:hemerythrin